MVVSTSTGAAVTVIVVVALTPPEAAVITAEPAATPVTVPAPFTVATPVAPDDHVIVAAIARPLWSLGDAVSWIVAPVTTAELPLIVMVVNTGGVADTLIVLVALTLPDVAVMTAEPTATPVTTPAPLTVAMPVAFDDHVMVAAMALPF